MEVESKRQGDALTIENAGQGSEEIETISVITEACAPPSFSHALMPLTVIHISEEAVIIIAMTTKSADSD